MQHSVVCDRLAVQPPQHKIYATGFRPAAAGVKPTPAAGRVKEKSSRKARSKKKPPTKNFRRLNFGHFPGYAPACQDRTDPETVRRAIPKRLDSVLPTPEAGLLGRLSDFVGAWCERRLKPVVKMDTATYLSSTSYNEERKEQLLQAEIKNRGKPPPKRYRQHANSFLKNECFDEPKEARTINSRHDRFKIWAGPYIKACEVEVYKLPEFIKHVPVPDRPSAINGLYKSGWYYYENDFKNFEGSILPILQRRVECVVLKYLLRRYPDAAAIIAETDTGKASLNFRSTGLKFELEGERLSGDVWTSLFNGLHNLLIVDFLSHLKGATEHIRGFVEGDDGLFASQAKLEASDFARLGHLVEIQELRHPADGHFCGLTMSKDQTLMKDPRRVMRTFGWTESCIHAGHKVMDELLRAKAMSLAYEMPQCPIIGELAREALRLTSGVTERRFNDGYHDTPADYHGPTGIFNPSTIARQAFSDKFGVSPEAQLVCEEAIRRHDLGAVSDVITPTRWDLYYTSRYIEHG